MDFLYSAARRGQKRISRRGPSPVGGTPGPFRGAGFCVPEKQFGEEQWHSAIN